MIVVTTVDKMVDVETLLLPELWWKIFSFISRVSVGNQPANIRTKLRVIIQSDLCSLLLTCRYFCNIGSCPSLWSDVRIAKSQVGPTTSLQFLTWPRFSHLHSLDLSESRAGTGAVSSLLTGIHRLSGQSSAAQDRIRIIICTTTTTTTRI